MATALGSAPADQRAVPSAVSIPREDAFAGRHAELALLAAKLDEARRGHSRLVIIEGPPGIGKTRLIWQFVHAVQVGCLLHAGGDENESGLAFGVVEQLIASVTTSLPERLAAVGTGSGARLDPLAVGAEMVNLLGTLQDASPIVIVVDDVQWADRPSLQALTFALRRLRIDRILTLIATRSGSELLPDSLRRLSISEGGRRLGLGGLDAADLRELAAQIGTGTITMQAARRLEAHTEGNPLHARALFEELSPDVLRDGDSPLPAPRSFALLVLGRLAASPPEVERFVAAAAVLGLRCPLRLAARLAGVNDPLSSLDRAVAARLLQERNVRTERMVAFPHPLVRAAVYHGLGPARRAELHTRAAALTDDAATSLRHYVAASRGEDADLAGRLDALAQRQAAGSAWPAAADSLLSASRLTPDHAKYEDFLLRAVECMLVGGNAADANALAEEVATFPDTARQRYVLGRLAIVAGRHAEAETLLASAWDRCDATTEPEFAGLIAGLVANLYCFDGRGTDAVTWARRALELTRGRVPSSDALDVLLYSLAISGRAEEARALVAAAPGLTSSEPTQLDGLLAWGHLQAWTDDLAGAQATLSAAAVAHRRQGSLPIGLIALGALAETEYRLGAWDDAIGHAELAASAATDADQLWIAFFLHVVAAFPLAGRGEWTAAEVHVQTAQRYARMSGRQSDIAYGGTAEAHLAAALGDHQRVLAALDPVQRLANRDGVDEPGVMPWRELLVDALVAMGRHQQAEAVLAPFEALAAARRRRSALLGAARVRGSLEAARGRLDRADMAFRAGLVHAEHLSMPFDRALLELAYGRALRRAGKRSAAAAILQAAQDRFAQVGARPFLRRCEPELAACGLTPARRKLRSSVRLTPQELAVARLVAAGHSNREVASALVLSVKTVEYHLGKVYTKLGLTSRSQLVQRLEQD